MLRTGDLHALEKYLEKNLISHRQVRNLMSMDECLGGQERLIEAFWPGA